MLYLCFANRYLLHLEYMNRLIIFCLSLAFGLTASGQSLTLDSCRAMALRAGKAGEIARAEIEKARWERKAAKTNYFPKIDLTAGYMRTGDEISLLNKDQKGALSNLGTTATGEFGKIAAGIVAQHPELAPLVQQIAGKMPAVAGAGNAIGQGIVDALRTDTRNLTAGTILLTQPLYMGGKIMAYNRITQQNVALAEEKLRQQRQEITLDVDKAYWQIVALANKQRLATSYRDMLARLEEDVEKMINEGVATKSNLLAVSVKLNEAEMTLTKVEDGLTLSRMLLCQLCGLPLHSAPRLADEGTEGLTVEPKDVKPDLATAYEKRPELAQLKIADGMLHEKVKIARSEHLPQLAMTGGYMISNPNVFNGFDKKFRGTWGVGVMLKVPILNWGATRYKVNAAKVEAGIAALKQEEAREKIELQVTQEAFRINEAARKLSLSERFMDQAEENLRTARLGHREGVITTTDLLQAQTAWLQAHSDKIDAQIDIKISEAAYRNALGEE